MPRIRTLLRILAALFFISAGLNHFREPNFYTGIVPPQLPWRMPIVIISGIAEISGGIGLLIPPLRRPAAFGLIALLIAVFPANLYMAFNPHLFTDLHIPSWVLWLRLPLQFLFILWIWFAAQKNTPPPHEKHP